MRKTLAVGLLLAAALSAPAHADDDDGRYRIVNAEISGGKAAILLDTRTGRTWILAAPRDGSITWSALQFGPLPKGVILSPPGENDPLGTLGEPGIR